MLQFLIDSTPIALNPSTQIRLEINAPYFDNEGIPSSVVWHFDIPSEGNEEVFGYSNHLITRRKKKVFDCSIKLHSYPIGSGKMVVENTGANYRVVVTLNGFAIDFENTCLNEVPDSVFPIGATQGEVTAHVEKVNTGVIDAPYTFPIFYAPNWYGERGGDTDNPPHNAEWDNFVNKQSQRTGEPYLVQNTADANKNSLSPAPKLFHALRAVVGGEGYKLQGSLFEDEKLNTLVNINNHSLDFDLDVYRVEASFEYDKRISCSLPDREWSVVPFDTTEIDETGTFALGVYNCKETGWYKFDGMLVLEPIYSGYLKETNFEIKVGSDTNYYKDVFHMHEDPTVIDIDSEHWGWKGDEFRVELRIWFNSQPEAGVVMVLNTSYLNIQRDIENTNIHAPTLDLNNHLPPLKITSLLNDLRNCFASALFFDDASKTIEAEFLKDILASKDALDITENVEVLSEEITLLEAKDVSYKFNLEEVKEYDGVDWNVEIRPLYKDYKGTPGVKINGLYGYCAKSNAIYKSNYGAGDKTAQWEYYTHNFTPGGEIGGDEVSMDLAPTEMIMEYFPYVTAKAISPMVKGEEKEKMGLRLAYFSEYNTCSVSMSNYFINLAYNYPNGLDTLLNPWIDFIRMGEELKVKLASIDIWRMVEIMALLKPKRTENQPRWVMVNSVKYLPKQFSFIINVDGDVTDAEAILFKNRVE